MAGLWNSICRSDLRHYQVAGVGVNIISHHAMIISWMVYRYYSSLHLYGTCEGSCFEVLMCSLCCAMSCHQSMVHLARSVVPDLLLCSHMEPTLVDAARDEFYSIFVVVISVSEDEDEDRWTRGHGRCCTSAQIHTHTASSPLFRLHLQHSRP